MEVDLDCLHPDVMPGPRSHQLSSPIDDVLAQLSANSYIVIYSFKIDIRMKCGVIAVFLIEMKMKYFYVTLN